MKLINDIKKTHFYFSYSTTMNSSRLEGRGVKFISKEPAFIENYKLKFNKKSIDGTAKANIVAEEKSRVYGILYAIDIAEFEKIKNIEGLSSGHFTTRILPVSTLNGETFMANVFIANPKYVVSDDELRPSKDYVNGIMDIISEENFDTDYIEYIKSYL